MVLLTDRELLILKAIVQIYTDDGQPVGSKALVSKLPIHVSSATIRNEMATLEEMGLLKKTHSSSGRVPSIKGYRYYVDHLLKPDKVQSSDLRKIRSSFNQQFQEIDDIVAESADMLSQLTSYTAFTVKPELKDAKLEGFRLVPLGNHRVMAILVTDNGSVQNRTFKVPKNVNPEALESVIRIINDQLVGLTLGEVFKRLETDIPIQVGKYIETPEGFLDVFEEILKKSSTEHFFVGGRLNLLNFSKHPDPSSIRSLYSLMGRSTDLASVLGGSLDHNIQVQIGNEITNNLLKNYSLITATYDVDQHGKGVIAILGPTSMPYSRMIGLVGAFRTELAQRLIDYYHDIDDI
ncbi:Heat-inducible transcription repressor HrcA [Pediococcus damnosus]|uniref:Heat-inducible transcription repressor HrcA n=1 Tax=Pediococcus damnosus TaxID=51663 RepID=A0A143AQ31_9LACO|nr:heat-inducible transcriptional repressor HrcA [Pediococcus damnosus]AMV61611.1 Heat-inducible transcription repressor HrcA [Pediococcus damnosus]AMV62027.1 Heat-inducible transcription repressor HrcA [Pediococcus damnosus]AMV65973.1 Heat-inducible transcription repressor HrcA [Pediococcus damnosus]AMV68123.1 Heat-inducible transcription repressor HrcA [Pediococcus damnosus]AMV70309.1 Heat-inducible transcription repressor HrcA [Pediococcus damnosus]